MKQRLKQQARHVLNFPLPVLGGRQAVSVCCRTGQADRCEQRPHNRTAGLGVGLGLLLGATLALATPAGTAAQNQPASNIKAAGATATAPALTTATPAMLASVTLEQLSSSELRERIAAGSTTIIVPVGGTEQSGPYLALGKHNVRALYLAQHIALRLGQTLVAPVVAYVPEGEIKPPSGHMRFSGTISIPEATFEALLEATARSLRQHGFRDVIFIGDHGGYQKNLAKVAQKLNQSWAADEQCRAYALLDYYQAAQSSYVAELKSRGYSEAEIGTHAGLADTALTLAVDPSLVRSAAMVRQPKPGPADGVQGDPRRASAELGQLGLQRIVDSSVTRLRNYLNEREPRASTSSHRN